MALSTICFGAAVARAGTPDSWLGGVDFWTSPNWSVTTPPGYPDNASGGKYDASIAVAGSDVTLSTGVFLDNLSIGAGNSLEITSGAGPYIETYAGAGTLSNAGTIMLLDAGDFGAASITFDGTDVAAPMGMLTGGGTVKMGGGSEILGKTGAETLTSDNVIMGTGTITALNLINHGTINANVHGATLSISPSTAPGATGVKNVGTGAPMSGLLEATGGGTLALGIGNFDNTDPTHPGTIYATGGSTVTLGSFGGGTTVINGGTLAADPGGFIENINFATLNGVTLTPGTTYRQSDGTTTNLQGSITNGGAITVASGGFSTAVLVLNNGDATLSGGGTVMLEGTPTGNPFDPSFVKIWGFRTAGVAPRLAIGVAQTIIGSGQIGSHSTLLSPKLTNHGTITAMTIPPGGPPQGITIFPSILPAPAADAVINDGTIEASENSFLTFNNGIVTNTGPGGPGMIVAHGHMMLSSLIFQGSVTLNNGFVVLDGPKSQLQLNNATVRPDFLTNSTGGFISTVAPSTANVLGGAITNSHGLGIFVDDNSSLSMDNAALGGSVTNSAVIQVGTGAVAIGPASLTINQGSLTNFVGAANGTISVLGNGILTLKGAGGVNSTINGGAVEVFNAPGTIKLNEGTIHAGTLSNIAGGLITTVNGSKADRLGGIVHNPAGATIQVDTNSNLELETGGTYDNPGTIVLNGGPPNLSLLRPNGFGAGGSVSLTGGGSVVLRGDNSSNEISGVTGNERLVNVDNAISGGGKIGNLFGMISLTNKFQGKISATAGAGITIEPNADGVINGGLIETQGASLNLTKIAALDMTHGVFTNFDGGNLGTIDATKGTVYLNGPAPANNAVVDGGLVRVSSTLQLSNGTIHNGSITNLFISSVIQTDPAGPTTNTLGGTVTNAGGATIIVSAGSTLNLETTGTYNNAGTINVNAAAGSSLCPSGANGTLMLGGGGTVNLLGPGSSIFGATGTETLLNLNNTIAGGGTIGRGSMALTNRGLINDTDPGGMTIQPNLGGVTNSGTIQANGGGTLTLMGGGYTNLEGATNGLIQAVGIGDAITLKNDAVTGNAIVNGGDVRILAAGTINLAGATIHGGTLTNSGAGTINSVAATTNRLGGAVVNPAGGTIAIAANSTLLLETGGSYNNAGLIVLNGGAMGAPSNLQPDGAGGTVTLSGGGTVNMAAGGGGDNSIFGVAGNERLINLDNTVNGTGQIGLNLMSLTNDGTIDANVAPGITISPNSGGVINGGTLQASGGTLTQIVSLTLNGGTYTNMTGVIQALGFGSEVDLASGATINGGTLNSDAGGLIRVVDEAVLNSVTNSGNFAQNEGSITDLIGTITNNGTMVMPAKNFVTQIKLLSGNVILGGTGSVVLKNSALNQILAANGLDRLTIASGQTVHGTGNIGVGAMALTNQGTIIADQPTALTIQPNAAGFLNTGTLRAAAGSILNVTGGYTQTAGDTNVLGTLNVTAGPLTAGGGTLSGSGMSTISGGFSLTGTFTKLDSGTATISGPQSFGSGKSLVISGGTVKFNVGSGPVTVGSAVTATIASGATLELAGTVAALASGPGRVDITNRSVAPGIVVSGMNQQVGYIDGSGTTQVNAGSDLTANHVIQTALVIGGTAGSPARVTIAASDSSGNPLGQSSGFALAGSLVRSGPFGEGVISSASLSSIAADSADLAVPAAGNSVGIGNGSQVPEPSTLLLALLAVLSVISTQFARRHFRCQTV